jgi:hypothetical protein
MSAGRPGYGHAAEVARLLRGYDRREMSQPDDDTRSLALKELQQERVREEARSAEAAEQPADERAHRRRADKAAYLRDKLDEAAEADRDR